MKNPKQSYTRLVQPASVKMLTAGIRLKVSPNYAAQLSATSAEVLDFRAGHGAIAKFFNTSTFVSLSNWHSTLYDGNLAIMSAEGGKNTFPGSTPGLRLRFRH